MVLEEMHLQRKTLFDLVKVTWNVAQYLLQHVTYAATMFEVATGSGLGRYNYKKPHASTHASTDNEPTW